MFGTKAIIPVEIGLPSFWIKEYNEDTNSEWLWENLDLLKKCKEHVAMRMASCRQWLARYYNANVKSEEFKVRDLVLQQANIS